MIRTVVIGTFCDDSDEPLASSFYADWWDVHDLFDSERVFNAPSYYRCDGRITYDISDISINIRNGNEYDATGGDFVPVD